MVAVLCVTETVSWGIVYCGFPVMLRAMERDLGASRVAVTGAFSVGMAVSALMALPVGRWLDRHGPRGLMTAGSILAVALLLAWSRIQSLAGLYLVWLGLGFAMAAILYEPAFAAVVSWFRTRHRDRALLTITLAAGLASTIFMPIAAWLLERQGWRAALVTLAVMLAVLTIPLHALARASTLAEIFGPRHYGSIAGAVALGSNGARAAGPVGASLLMVALGGYEAVFWTFAVALVLVGVMVRVAPAHAPPEAGA